MTKTARLTAGLVAKKGQAFPAVAHETATPTTTTTTASAPKYYKALTIKLDKDRYEALKTAGLRLDKKSQEIFVMALDQYLDRLARQVKGD